jgi:hypothetical protein
VTHELRAYQIKVAKIEHRIWMAEFIGWPALADSWRKTLTKLEEEYQQHILKTYGGQGN